VFDLFAHSATATAPCGDDVAGGGACVGPGVGVWVAEVGLGLALADGVGDALGEGVGDGLSDGAGVSLAGGISVVLGVAVTCPTTPPLPSPLPIVSTAITTPITIAAASPIEASNSISEPASCGTAACRGACSDSLGRSPATFDQGTAPRGLSRGSLGTIRDHLITPPSVFGRSGVEIGSSETAGSLSAPA
jgi:hypothetical protein